MEGKGKNDNLEKAQGTKKFKLLTKKVKNRIKQVKEKILIPIFYKRINNEIRISSYQVKEGR